MVITAISKNGQFVFQGAFRAFDKNGSGDIDTNELSDVFKAIGKCVVGKMINIMYSDVKLKLWLHNDVITPILI